MAWAICSTILAGKSHGQRSLAGYSSQGCKESDRTEATERGPAQPPQFRWPVSPTRRRMAPARSGPHLHAALCSPLVSDLLSPLGAPRAAGTSLPLETVADELLSSALRQESCKCGSFWLFGEGAGGSLCFWVISLRPQTSVHLGSAKEDGVCPGSQPLRAHGLQLQGPLGALDSTSELMASG